MAASPVALVSLFLALLLPSIRADVPQIDYSQLGKVAIAGSFAGIQFYDPQYPTVTFDTNASSFILRTPEGVLHPLASTNPGGQINALCQSSASGLVYIGGSFARIGQVDAANIAQFDPSSRSLTALGSGLDGPVTALSCLDSSSTLYVGGTFKAPVGSSAASGYGGSVASWSYGSKAWSPLPFSGLNGPVDTISPSSNGASLFFGGSFRTTFANGNGVASTSTSSSPSSSSAGGTNGSGIGSLGSSLTPISLNASTWNAGPTTYTSGFGRPQYVFCPSGPDGIGTSWLLVDGSFGHFTVNLDTSVQAGGIRLGNTFYEGRGTRSFSVTSIPDDTVLQLTYLVDPANPSTSATATCTDTCPLGHNSSIPYEDFIFPNGTTLTGFQITITGWYGAGGGFHLIQLLSPGSFAYAVGNQVGSACTSGLGATQAGAETTTSGTWAVDTVPVTSTPGATEKVLVSVVPVGTPSSSSPSVTWSPFISAGGLYDIYLYTPGCLRQGNCAARTSVDLSVQTGGGAPNTTTVSEKNQQDEATLIYSGALQPSSAGATTITLRLSANPSAVSGANYNLVADKVQLIAHSTNGSSSSAFGLGQGVYEYVLSGTGAFGDSSVSPTTVNASSSTNAGNATGFDSLGFGLAQNSTVKSIIPLTINSSPAVAVGGVFSYSGNLTSTSSNIIVYAGSNHLAIPNGGLNGPVNALADSNGYLYAGGAFTQTSDGSVTGLSGVARWKYSDSSAKWEPVPGVANTPIDAFGLLQGGNSTDVLLAGAATLATVSSASNAVDSTPAMVAGSILAVATTSNGTAYVAGPVQALAEYGAPGFATVQQTSDGSLQAFAPNFTLSAGVIPDATGRSRSLAALSHSHERSMVRNLADIVLPRFATFGNSVQPVLPRTHQARAPIPQNLISSTFSTANPRVVDTAFWTNGSSDIVFLAGQFTTSSGVRNIAAYNTSSNTTNVVANNDLIGSVNVAQVIDDQLWLGGNFSNGQRQGLVTLNLSTNAWAGDIPPLAGYSSQNVSVNVIVTRPGVPSTVIVAGSFGSAGSLPCPSVCVWDTTHSQWNALSGGLRGSVAAVDFVGKDRSKLIVVGDLELSGQSAPVLQWDFNAQNWSAFGPASIPGPASAVSGDDGNEQSIWVAGVAADLQTPYLIRWNGSAWSDASAGGLGRGTGIEQLRFLPLSNTHSGASVIESNRALVVSGALSLSDAGNVSTALFDGSSWTPYIMSYSASGAAGIISGLFFSVGDIKFSSKQFLATGLVILVSIAISLGIVFVLVLIGLLVALRHRGDQEQTYPVAHTTEDDDVLAHRPTSLLTAINQATAMIATEQKGEKKGKGSPSAWDEGASASGHDQALHGLGFGATPGGVDTSAEEDGYAVMHARRDFEAESPGELSMRANEEVRVLDRSDDNWWLVMSGDGIRGVVPSSFLI